MLKNNFTLFANFLSVRQIGLGVLVALGVITLSSCGGGDSSSSSTTSSTPTVYPSMRLTPTLVPGNPVPGNLAPSSTPGTPPSGSYSVSVTVKGLSTNQSVVLENNKNTGDQLKFSADGTATFSTTLASGSRYLVKTVNSTAVDYGCTVSNGAGVIASSNVNITVTCSTESYTVSVAVSGMGGFKKIIVENNEDADDQLIFTTNTTSTFKTRLVKGETYDVTIADMSTSANCTLTNGKGKISANVTVPVQCSSDIQTFSISATVSGLGSGTEALPVVLKNASTGDSLAFTTNGAQTFKTEEASGDAYKVVVKTQPPNRKCTVSNGEGTVPGANVMVNVACSLVNVAGGYAYVTNSGDSTVSLYSIGTNGIFTPLSIATVATGKNPAGIVVNAAGTYAYVVNRGQNSVSMYAIDRTTGVLNPGASIATGGVPIGIAISPDGDSLYVTNTLDPSDSTSVLCDATQINCNLSGTVSMYSINSQGALTLIGTKRTSGTLPNIITIDPSGTYAYVTNFDSDTITQFKINSDGSLSYVWCSTQPTGWFPVGMSINPNGQYAYVANLGSSSIDTYSISSRTGRLTLLFPIPSQWTWTPYLIAINPAGTFAYVTNTASNTVSMYSITGSGVLNPLTPSTIASGTSPLGITTYTSPALGSSSSFIYVVNDNSNTISMYSVLSSGQLQALSTSTVQTGSQPYGIATWRLQ
jgi:6-phosphogluconolactonase (cycloisomerase 2 family)